MSLYEVKGYFHSLYITLYSIRQRKSMFPSDIDLKNKSSYPPEASGLLKIGTSLRQKIAAIFYIISACSGRPSQPIGR